MRTLSLLILTLLSTTSLGCKNYCCLTEDGTPFVASFGCGDLKEIGQEEDDEDIEDFERRCEQSSTSNTDTTKSTSEATPCEQFCRHVLDACPSDTSCVESCEDLTARDPGADDIACADRATNCDQTNACFGPLF